MAENEVQVTITGRDQMSATLKGAKDNADGFGASLGKIGQIASGVVLGSGIMQAPSFLLDAAKAATEDEASVMRLKQAVENAGTSWDSYKGGLDEVIASGQKKAFTDDDVRDSLSLLTAQTGDASEAQKRFGLAMDLSRGANIDVVTASKLLGKVTDENVNVLARYGIKVAAGASETELFGAIQQKFGGQADAFAKSTAGQMEITKIKLSELKESIGYAVLPILVKLGTIAADVVFPALEKIANAAGPAFAAVGDAIDEVIAKAEPVFQRIGSAASNVLIPALHQMHDTIGDFIGDIKWITENGAGFNEKLAPQFGFLSEAIGGTIFHIEKFIGDVKWLVQNGGGLADIVYGDGSAATVWDKAAVAVATVVAIFNDKLKPALEDIKHYFTLGLFGGDAGGDLGRFGQIAFDVGEKVRQMGGIIKQALEEVRSKLSDFLGGNKTELLQALGAMLAYIGSGLVISGLVAAALAIGGLAVAIGAATLAAAFAVISFAAVPLAIAAVAFGIIELIKHWDEITARFPILGQASDAVLATLQRFTAWVTDSLFPALKNIGDTFADVGRTIADGVQGHWDQIRGIIEGVMSAIGVVVSNQWDTIKIVFQGAMDIIQGVLKVFHGLFTGDWQEMWDGVKEILSGAFDIITGIVGNMKDTALGLLKILWEGISAGAQAAGSAVVEEMSHLKDGALGKLGEFLDWVGQFPGFMLDKLGDLGSLLLDVGHDLLTGLWNGAKNGWEALGEWERGLPMMIKDAIGDLGMLLWDIGWGILNGLWSGMKNAWDTVSGWVSNVAGWIKGLKGPIEDDRLLLVPEGQAIMEGLGTGLQDGFANTVAPIVSATAQKLIDQLNGMWTQYATTTKDGSDAVLSMWDNYQETLADVSHGIVGTIAEDFSIVSDHFYDFSDTVATIGGTVTDSFGKMVDGIKTGLAPLTPFLTSVADAVKQWGAGVLEQMSGTYVQALAISAQIAAESAKGAAAQAVLGGANGLTAPASIAAAAAAPNQAQAIAAAQNNTGLSGSDYDQLTPDQQRMLNQLAGTNAAIAAQQAANGMASGGYVPSRSGGTLMRLGEGGEGEWVIPESKLPRRGGGGNIYYSIALHITQPLGTPDAIARAVQEALVHLERRGGIAAGTTRALA